MKSSPRTCPTCGTALPATAPDSICPRCLVARVLAPAEGAAGPADFGDFTIGELLGRGGMGAVYRARQRSLDREVALKLLPLDLLDDEDFLERFEREARLMARLTHPGIARVFEAGISESGQPYLAMELIAGEPITAYVQARGLRLRERLALFQQVCAAVQHAHQRGIIHRDLKPSNILVGEQGVKVIDFGLARPLGDAHGDVAVWRSATHAVGTPAYMSPEQAAGGEVETSTDVYSLGVLLCELLAGALPFPDEKLRGSTREAIAAFLRDTPTPRPSEIVAASPSAPRVRDLRGDLDAICLRALAKEPAQRYATVAALAEDLARHLRSEPVSAVPATPAYLLGKFARRHRTVLGVAAGIFAVLASASVFSADQARTARRQRDAAELAQTKAERMKDFLAAIFIAPSPEKSGRDVRVVDVLGEAAQRLGADLADDPEVLAEMRLTIGYTYFMLSQYPEAEPLLRTAVEDHRRVFGNDAAETGQALHNLGGLLAWTSRSDEALPLLHESAAILRRHLPGSAQELTVALQNISTAHVHAGRDATAEPALREGIAVAEQYLGSRSVAANSLRGDLAGVLEKAGRVAEARAMIEQVIARMREVPSERMDLATMLGKWSDLVFMTGETAAAEQAMRECLALRREVFGERGSPTGLAWGKLAYLRYRAGDFAQAEEYARQGLAIQRETHQPGERDFLFTLRPLGLALAKAGHREEAASFLDEALALAKKFAPEQVKMHAELTAARGE